MERLVRFALGAFVGWLLVNISGASRMIAERLAFTDTNGFVSNLGSVILVIGWLAAIVFSVPVLYSAIKSFKRPNK